MTRNETLKASPLRFGIEAMQLKRPCDAERSPAWRNAERRGETDDGFQILVHADSIVILSPLVNVAGVRTNGKRGKAFRRFVTPVIPCPYTREYGVIEALFHLRAFFNLPQAEGNEYIRRMAA